MQENKRGSIMLNATNLKNAKNNFSESLFMLNDENISYIFKTLKQMCGLDLVDADKKNNIVKLVQKYGYLPMSQIQALVELSDAEALLAVEEKLKLNKIYNGENFCFTPENISPVSRAGYKNSEWLLKEGHGVKLVNLAGLGNGNRDKAPGKFFDWLKQLAVLPSGNPDSGVLSTTMYLIPFHPREFGCAYLPKSSEVSENLQDTRLKEKFMLDAKNQVRLFIALTQLAGHPVIYDVLPQTGRFSKTVLAAPYAARWFNIRELVIDLNEEIEKISLKLSKSHNHIFVERAKTCFMEELSGIYIPLTEDLKETAEIFDKELLKVKKRLSNAMLSKEKQEFTCQKAKEIISKMLKKPVNSDLTEEDIANHGEVIQELIKEGLWPAPGGAWCSSGVPVFDKMSEGAGYPMFRHFDNKGEDVSKFANLDCQTPYYFTYFDKHEYNHKVIDFYINFLKKLRNDYNFDGFRVDHIDHIVDEVSEKNGFPISYRAPSYVLGLANREIKKEVLYFATLAEYMLWDDFYKEYHSDMGFDLLWGNDIISQYTKTVEEIIKDNKKLQEYNSSIVKDSTKLSILKIYNNQDGEFREINQYPGQLGEDGALFKWFKYKFLPGGGFASRPMMFIDGDESFTKTGIESVIGAEESMKREDNREFFRKFDAISRFALNNKVLLGGKAELVFSDEEKGFVSWLVKIESSKEAIFIAANQKPPTEVTRNKEGEVVNTKNSVILDVEAFLPKGYLVVCEYVLNRDSFDFEEAAPLNIRGEKLFFDKLEASEFHIYKLSAILQ